MKKSYQEKKEEARRRAQEWQNYYSNFNYSYMDLLSWQDFFYNIGKKYGLIREFKENGII